MNAATRRRVLLSIVAILLIGGATIGIAASSTTLRKKAPSLKARSLTPSIKVTNFVPGDRTQRVIILTNTSARTLRSLRFEMAEKPSKVAGTTVPAPRGKTTPSGFEWARQCVVAKKRLKSGKIRRVTRCRTRLRPAPSRMLTDPNGLRVVVEACPVAWKRTSPRAVTFDCPPTVRVKVRTRLKSGKYRTRIVTQRIRPVVLVRDAKLPARGTIRRIPKFAPKTKLNIRITTYMPISAGNELQGRTVTLIPRFIVPGR